MKESVNILLLKRAAEVIRRERLIVIETVSNKDDLKRNEVSRKIRKRK